MLTDAHRRAPEAEHVVAHQRLVHAANLFDVERSVAEPLALEDHEAVEHAVDRAVVDARGMRRGARLGVHDRGGPAGQSALEEWVGVRIEQPPPAGREVECAVLHAEEHGAKEREELPVRAEAVVHALRVRASVVAQARVKAGEAQVLGVRRMLDGDEALVLGVEEEDQAQNDARTPW